jgi:hypothetical protein
VVAQARTRFAGDDRRPRHGQAHRCGRHQTRHAFCLTIAASGLQPKAF